jgi:uncharacterized membrane protein
MSAPDTVIAPAATAFGRPAKPPGWKGLATLLAGAGVLHFVLSEQFNSMVPKQLGDPKPYVQASGVAELAIAAGLAIPRTRRLAGLASAVLLVGVYPANVDMTVQAFRSSRATPAWKAALVGRLPLQVPIVVRSWQLWKRG